MTVPNAVSPATVTVTSTGSPDDVSDPVTLSEEHELIPVTVEGLRVVPQRPFAEREGRSTTGAAVSFDASMTSTRWPK